MTVNRQLLLFAAAGFCTVFAPVMVYRALPKLDNGVELTAESTDPQGSSSILMVEDLEEAPAAFEAKLALAWRLYQGEGADRHRVKVGHLLDSCSRTWTDASQLLLLGEAAHRLPFSEGQLKTIADGISGTLSPSQTASILLAWRCQPDLEYLFFSLPEGLRRRLSLEPGLLVGIFGYNTAERFFQLWAAAGDDDLPRLDQVYE